MALLLLCSSFASASDAAHHSAGDVSANGKWVVIVLAMVASVVVLVVPMLRDLIARSELMSKTKSSLQEMSIPLIMGVVAALFAANFAGEWYHHFVHNTFDSWLPHELAHYVSVHFLVNEVFMVFFFGMAAVEIVEATLPGGDLNPPRKAINPLLGTLGGVLGPIGVYLLLVMISGKQELAKGWGIPTATDIALAWLVAKLVFGETHSAVKYLLLLAVADDAIGLGIIAVAYPDPHHPAEPVYLWLCVVAMVFALGLRWRGSKSWVAFMAPGALSWCGLYFAHLHPALALVLIAPFMPWPERDEGMFAEGHDEGHAHSVLGDFGHDIKTFVDFGLFLFAFANAGVAFKSIGAATWIVFAALAVGKTLGITLFSWLGTRIGAPLPKGMGLKHLMLAGFIAGLGLTVALFVSGQAFQGVLQEQAKMGALLSGLIAFVAIGLGRILDVRVTDDPLQEDLVDPKQQVLLETDQAELEDGVFLPGGVVVMFEEAPQQDAPKPVEVKSKGRKRARKKKRKQKVVR